VEMTSLSSYSEELISDRVMVPRDLDFLSCSENLPSKNPIPRVSPHPTIVTK
jgi:hypothetical protein